MSHNAGPTFTEMGESGYLTDLRAENLALRWLLAEARWRAEEFSVLAAQPWEHDFSWYYTLDDGRPR